MLIPRGPAGPRRLAAVALAGASVMAAAAVGSIFLTTALDSWTAIAAAGPAAPADGILLTAAAAGAVLTLWLGLGLALSALSALPGALGQISRRLAARIAPAAVRKVVAFVLGTTLTAALVPGTAVAGIGREAPRPAVAAAPYAATAISGLTDAAPDVSFSFLGDRVDVRAQTDVVDAAPPPAWFPDRPARRPAAASAADRIVVHRGDTLWSIAARHLGPGATRAEIDAEWPRWLVANRDVIGDNANLILPGQLLRAPASPPEGA